MGHLSRKRLVKFCITMIVVVLLSMFFQLSHILRMSTTILQVHTDDSPNGNPILRSEKTNHIEERLSYQSAVSEQTTNTTQKTVAYHDMLHDFKNSSVILSSDAAHEQTNTTQNTVPYQDMLHEFKNSSVIPSSDARHEQTNAKQKTVQYQDMLHEFKDSSVVLNSDVRHEETNIKHKAVPYLDMFNDFKSAGSVLSGVVRHDSNASNKESFHPTTDKDKLNTASASIRNDVNSSSPSSEPDQITQQKKMLRSPNLNSFPISDQSSHKKSFVFPSVEERISYYMGSHWSNKSVNALGKELPTTIKCSPDPYQPDSQAVLQMEDIKYSDDRIVRPYFEELNRLFDSVIDHSDTRFALLVQLGDSALNAKTKYFPFVVKSRYAAVQRRGENSSSSSEQVEPIIVPFNFQRHYAGVYILKRHSKSLSTSWNDKSEKIFWRGATNGPFGCFRYGRSIAGDNCDRLQIVRRYHNVTRHHSTDIDIGFSESGGVSRELSDEMDSYLKPSCNMKCQLKYKYLISVEGNDVASDLKWKLYSNSVVFMKPPSKVTWAMEDKLIPFYHYIPLADDFSDLLEKLDWARNHEEECKKISYQSTKYIESLVTSDQAIMDENIILKSIFESYQNRFGHYLYDICEKRPHTHRQKRPQEVPQLPSAGVAPEDKERRYVTVIANRKNAGTGPKNNNQAVKEDSGIGEQQRSDLTSLLDDERSKIRAKLRAAREGMRRRR